MEGAWGPRMAPLLSAVPATRAASLMKDGAPGGTARRPLSPASWRALHPAARASQRLAVRRAYTTARRRATGDGQGA
jgi:hypothetical protein